MKRLLFLFLMALLPLQMSWAAVGSYCQHEQGRAAQHLGHHEHKHDKQQPKDEQNAKLKLGDDPDCDRCHHAHGNVVATTAAQPIFPLGTVAVASVLLPYRSHIPDIPTKPDRRRAS